MEPGAANRGRVRPPIVYLAAILIGVLLHRMYPLTFLPASVSALLGIPTVLVAIALFVSSVRTFRTAGTPVPRSRPTTTIVRDGPYRYSRNPIYLAFSLFQLGIALWMNSAWLVITLVPAAALMVYVVVPSEERYLEARFLSEYLSYKSSVRRWL